MKRKTLVKIHLAATILAVLTISSFFVSSLIAEINGDPELIKKVKETIFFSLPLLLVVMPALGITGIKLAGKSRNVIIAAKLKRMKFIAMNGIILIALATLLYYKSKYQTIDDTFLLIQVIEIAFGFSNLVLIGMNIKSGMKLSGRLKNFHYKRWNYKLPRPSGRGIKSKS